MASTNNIRASDERRGRGGNCVGSGSRCWSVEAEMMLWMVAARLLCLKNLVRAQKPADRFGKWGHRFVSKNKKQICEDKKPKKQAN